ncbi:MAG: TolC family outer membrane protein, partial [Phenylobacterium sp.]|nr:TolC family outer membrane protein [Phenylobacterium sp.]
MFISRRGALLAAVFTAGLSFGGPASAESLADAIALAYETNPTLQAQRASLRALDESIVQARSGWRPSLSASASGQYTETRTPRQLVDLNGDGIPETSVGGIDEGNAGSAGLNLTQPVWTGGRVGAAVSAAQADVFAGQENLRRIEAEVLGGVIVAYVDVRRDQEALRIRQDNVQVLTRQLEETDARFEVGEITRTDVAQAQARLAAAEAQMRSAEAQLAITRAGYAAIVGQNPGDLAPEPPLTAVLPATVDQAYEAAERNNPQLRQARYNAQAAAARVAAARAERMPNLSLTGSVGWSGLADPFEPSDYSRNVTGRATLTVPIFTGGLNNSRVRAARERENASELTVEQARRSALQNVTQAWSQLLAARANIGSTDVQV